MLLCLEIQCRNIHERKRLSIQATFIFHECIRQEQSNQRIQQQVNNLLEIVFELQKAFGETSGQKNQDLESQLELAEKIISQ